jgi:hypothetical protein
MRIGSDTLRKTKATHAAAEAASVKADAASDWLISF